MARSSKKRRSVLVAVGVIALSFGGLWAYTVYGSENSYIYKTAMGVRSVAVDFVNRRQSWPLTPDELKQFVQEQTDAGSWKYLSSWEWVFEKLGRYRVTWIYARHPDGSIEMRLTFRGTGPFGWFSQRRDVIIPVDQLEGDVPPLPREGDRRDDVARL